MRAVIAVTGTISHSMARMVADGMRCVTTYAAAAAAAGAISHSMARMVADGMRCVTTYAAAAAAAGAVSHGMARGDWVISCCHTVCRSIRGESMRLCMRCLHSRNPSVEKRDVWWLWEI